MTAVPAGQGLGWDSILCLGNIEALRANAAQAWDRRLPFYFGGVITWEAAHCSPQPNTRRATKGAQKDLPDKLPGQMDRAGFRNPELCPRLVTFASQWLCLVPWLSSVFLGRLTATPAARHWEWLQAPSWSEQQKRGQFSEEPTSLKASWMLPPEQCREKRHRV